MKKLTLNGNSLDIESLVAVALGEAEVEILPETLQKIEKSRNYIKKQVEEKKIVDGVSTGLGAKDYKVIDDYQTAKEIQSKILLSLACGV